MASKSGFEAGKAAVEAAVAVGVAELSSPSSSCNCFGDSPKDQESLENAEKDVEIVEQLERPRQIQMTILEACLLTF